MYRDYRDIRRLSLALLLRKTVVIQFQLFFLNSTFYFMLSFFPFCAQKSSFKRRLEDMINMLDNGKETNRQVYTNEFLVRTILWRNNDANLSKTFFNFHDVREKHTLVVGDSESEFKKKALSLCVKASFWITVQHHITMKIQKIIWSFSDSSKTKAGEFTVTASLKLAEVCLENLSFRDDIDLICLAIRLLFSSIHQWQSGPVDCETDDKVNKTDAYLREDCVRKISKKVVSKLRGVPESNMELQVQIILQLSSDN